MKYKYINLPTTVNLINDNLWVGFGTAYTGVIKFGMNETNIFIKEVFQKTYLRKDSQMALMYGNDYTYETTIREIKHSFVDENKTLIYCTCWLEIFFGIGLVAKSNEV